MFKKILIANRGEIAVRIIRTCREMGIHTVAVYSEVDAAAAHVLEADEAVLLGESEPSKSYLNIERIIAVAKSRISSIYSSNKIRMNGFSTCIRLPENQPHTPLCGPYVPKET